MRTLDRDWRRLPYASAIAISLVAGLGIGVVEAQTVGPGEGAPAKEATQPDQAPELQTIVVTAEKRSESLLLTPVAVDVVQAPQMREEHITSVGDLSRAIPSINTEGSLGILGVSTGGVARSSEEAVSTVVDGVSMSRDAISNLFDIQSVQVLEGPQGMLFGKNSSAGVINIVTNPPDPSHFEAIGHIDYGDYGYQREDVVLNVPLSSTAAFRVVLHHQHDDGVTTDTLTGQELYDYGYGGRVRFLWEPSDKLKINLIGDWEKDSSNGIPDVTEAIVPASSVLSQLVAACGITPGVRNNLSCAEGIGTRDAASFPYGGSLQVDYKLPSNYLVTSITALRRSNTGDLNYFGPGGDSDILSENILSQNLTPTGIRSFSQELRLTSSEDQLISFVSGLYYYEYRSTDRIIQAGTLGAYIPGSGAIGDLVALGILPLPPGLVFGRVNNVNVYDRSSAAFGEAKLHATKKLTFIAGGRYTREYLKDFSYNFDAAELASHGYFDFPGFSDSLVPVDEGLDITNFSWRLGLQYQWSPAWMSYFTWTRGYKGPAVNDQAGPPLVIPVVKPEIPTYFDLGVKGQFWDNRVGLTASLFHTKVVDFQASVYIPPSLQFPAGSFAQGNAPYITTEGVEVNAFGRPFDGFTLNAGAIYDRAKYAPSFLVSCAPEQTPGVGSCSATGVTTATSQLAGVPKFRVVLNGMYERSVSESLIGFLQSDTQFQTGFNSSPSADPVTYLGNQWTVNGRIGVRRADDRWAISLWARNIFDKIYQPLAGDPVGGFDGGGLHTYWNFPFVGAGRTVGASLDFNF